MWPRLAVQLAARGEAWLRDALEAQRTLALAIHAQILELDRRLATLAARTLTIPLPHGLGALTAEAAAYGTNGGRRTGETLTACLEVMDWTRFSNRKKAGSFIGCAPSDTRPAWASSSAASIARATGACAAC